MSWPRHWPPVENSSQRAAIELELQKELKAGHPLYRLPVAAIGQRDDQDDYLFQLLDGSGCVADVHLTFAGEREKPPWPISGISENFTA